MHADYIACSIVESVHMYDTGRMEYKTDSEGLRRRVHRENVDVIVHVRKDGSIEPVMVIWRDGRSFVIDEILEMGEFGEKVRGRKTACYRIRFGNHETELYLERREARPEVSQAEAERWWVYAYDAPRGGRTPA